MHSGVPLHHLAQLYGHPLMHHATMLVSPGGAHIMRLLSAATGLASLLQGEALPCPSRSCCTCKQLTAVALPLVLVLPSCLFVLTPDDNPAL